MSSLLAIIILVLSIPIGFFLKWITKEEIKPGKKYFFLLFILSLILSLSVLLLPINIILKKSSFFSLIFISIVSYISWYEPKKGLKTAKKT